MTMSCYDNLLDVPVTSETFMIWETNYVYVRILVLSNDFFDSSFGKVINSQSHILWTSTVLQMELKDHYIVTCLNPTHPTIQNFKVKFKYMCRYDSWTFDVSTLKPHSIKVPSK